MTEERPMKLLTKFLCAIGRHVYDGGYWYEGRNTPREHWVHVKTCVHCKHKEIGFKYSP